MNHEKYRGDFETLELTPDASLSEVKQSYHLLKDLYSNKSIVTVSVEDEISDFEKKKILDQVEAAYQNLLAFFQEEPALSGPAGRRAEQNDFQEVLAEISSYSGLILKEIREKLNVGLHEIAMITKIQIRYLENLEAENYADLPDEVYTRGFVTAYAKHLSLDAQKVADDYMAEFRAARINRPKHSNFW
ncbi:MAG: helix-turn-helix domain-containing protein [Deltaproteobacteria bacterium]|nr:helix-turn-helix domain-containing protein [Deltaproteobacteria bacterium]